LSKSVKRILINIPYVHCFARQLVRDEAIRAMLARSAQAPIKLVSIIIPPTYEKS